MSADHKIHIINKTATTASVIVAPNSDWVWADLGSTAVSIVTTGPIGLQSFVQLFNSLKLLGSSVGAALKVGEFFEQNGIKIEPGKWHNVKEKSMLNPLNYLDLSMWGTIFGASTATLFIKVGDRIAKFNTNGDYNWILNEDRIVRAKPDSLEEEDPAAGVKFWMQWKDVDHANDVVAMTATADNLYCATSDNKLYVRSTRPVAEGWQHIGHADDVVGLAASGERLFCVTKNNQLYVRDTRPIDMPWQSIGHANEVVALTATRDRLFCVTRDNQLHARDFTLSDTPWQPVGHANDVVALAASDGRLFCVTKDGWLWSRDPVLSEVLWKPLGGSEGVVGLAGISGKLYCATKENRLMVRDV